MLLKKGMSEAEDMTKNRVLAIILTTMLTITVFSLTGCSKEEPAPIETEVPSDVGTPADAEEDLRSEKPSTDEEQYAGGHTSDEMTMKNEEIIRKLLDSGEAVEIEYDTVSWSKEDPEIGFINIIYKSNTGDRITKSWDYDGTIVEHWINGEKQFGLGD
jgi:hypothetical protein